MGTKFVLNLVGVPLGEKDMATIPYPLTEMHIHVTTKTVQAGGLLGTLLAAPISTAVTGPHDMATLKSRAESYGRYGVMLGLVVGPLMTYNRLRDAETPAVWDRCYRLRYNYNQRRVDRLALVGAAAGFMAARSLQDSGALGALVGMSSGCILAAVLNTMM